jgi:hypothetical protein
MLLVAAIAATAADSAPNLWPTTAPTAAPDRGAKCGDALLDGDETCESCAADCQPRSCQPAGRHAFDLSVAPPLGAEPIAATLRVSYRTDRLMIPGTEQEDQVRERIDFGPDAGITALNDLDHSLRLVRGEGNGLVNPLVSIEFDGCKGAPSPTAADIACVVEGCAGAGGVINGCTCTATPRAKP